MRAAARILGLIGAFVSSLLAFVGSQAMQSGPGPLILFGPLLLALVGYAVAWREERVGGALMIVGALVLGAVVFSGTGDLVSALVWAATLGLAGYLFVRCAQEDSES